MPRTTDTQLIVARSRMNCVVGVQRVYRHAGKEREGDGEALHGCDLEMQNLCRQTAVCHVR